MLRRFNCRLYSCGIIGIFASFQISVHSTQPERSRSVTFGIWLVECIRPVADFITMLTTSSSQWLGLYILFTILGNPVICLTARSGHFSTCYRPVIVEQEHMEQVPIRRGNQSLEAAKGLNNLLYSADVDFSCFADLALTSPVCGVALPPCKLDCPSMLALSMHGCNAYLFCRCVTSS